MRKYPLPNKNHKVVKDIKTLQETFAAIDEDIVALENKTADTQEKITEANDTFVHTDISLANSVIQDIAPERYVSISSDGIKCVDSSDNVGGKSGQCSIKKSDANFDVAWGDVWEISKNGMTTLQNATEGVSNETHILCDVCEINNNEQLPRNNFVNIQVIGNYEIESNEGVTLSDTLEQILDEENIATRQNRGIVKIGDGVHVIDGIISADVIQKTSIENAGIVKIGKGIQIENGIISVEEIQQATKEKFGVIKLGNDFEINTSGAMEINEMPTTIYDLGKIKTCELGNIEIEESIVHYRVFVNEDTVIKINETFVAKTDFSFVLEIISTGLYIISFDNPIKPVSNVMPINRGTTKIYFTKKFGIPYYEVIVSQLEVSKPQLLTPQTGAINNDFLIYAPEGSTWHPNKLLRNYYDGYCNCPKILFEFETLVCVEYVKYWSRSSSVAMNEFILKGSNDGKNWTTLLYKTNEIIYGEIQTEIKGCFRFFEVTIGYNSDDNRPSGVTLWGTQINNNESDLRLLTPYTNSNISDFMTFTGSNITSGSVADITDDNFGTRLQVQADNDGKRWVKYELETPAAANVLQILIGNWNTNRQANWFKLEASNNDEDWTLLLERQYLGTEVFKDYNMLFYKLGNETAYKYYKLSCIATNDSNTTWVLSGFMLYQRIIGRDNFYRGMPYLTSTSHDGYEVTASSQYNDEHAPQFAFDGDLNTKWASRGTGNQWLQVKFPDLTICNAAKITSRNDGDFNNQAPKNFEIQGSLDGEAWETLTTEEGITWTTRGQTQIFRFENETAYQYYRLQIAACNGGADYSLGEFSIGSIVHDYKRYLKKYDYLVPILGSDEEMIEEGVYKLTSSSEHSDHKRKYLFDRRFDTRFELNGETSGWVQVELPTAKIANLFSIGSRSDSWCDAAPRNYSLLGSNDGVSWTTLFSVTNSSAFSGSELRTHEINEANAYKYYRLNVGNSARTVLTFAQWNLVFKHEIQEY